MTNIKLTKRGQIIAERAKQRMTVRKYTNRLYNYKSNGELVGCEIVDLARIFPQKNCQYLL